MNSINTTIKKILDAATVLFMEKGLDQTSMQDIVHKTGMSKGAIYHYFRSKSEIIVAVMNQQTELVKWNAFEYLEQIKEKPAREKMSFILSKSIEDQQRHKLNQVLSLQRKSPDFIVSYMRDCVYQNAPLFAELINEGIQDGSVNTEYPNQISEVFFLLINIWCDPAIYPCSAENLFDRLQSLQFILRSIGVDIIENDFLKKAKDLILNTKE